MAWYHNSTKRKAKPGELVFRKSDSCGLMISRFSPLSHKNGAALWCRELGTDSEVLYLPSEVGLFHSSSQTERFDEPDTV